MLGYVASQLGENPAAFDRYARSRDTTRREHFSEIMRTFGFRAFDERVYRELYRWLLPLVMSIERGTALVEAALGEMRRRGILAPAITTIEELCWEARRDARRSVFERLPVGSRRRGSFRARAVPVPPGLGLSFPWEPGSP